jgi:hypothetical protein
VPCSPEHLHGDGEFIQGEINIIGADSFLRGDFESFVAEFSHKFPFPFSDPGDPVELALNSNGAAMGEIFSLFRAANSGVSGQSVASVFLRRAASHHQDIGGGITPNVNTVPNQNPPNYVTADSESLGQRIFGLPDVVPFYNYLLREWNRSIPCSNSGFTASPKYFGELIHGLAGKITFVSVLSVRNRQFSGHVYDLQTFSSLYRVGSVIASNCRCVCVAATEDEIPEGDVHAMAVSDSDTLDPDEYKFETKEDFYDLKYELSNYDPKYLELLNKASISFHGSGLSTSGKDAYTGTFDKDLLDFLNKNFGAEGGFKDPMVRKVLAAAAKYSVYAPDIFSKDPKASSLIVLPKLTFAKPAASKPVTPPAAPTSAKPPSSTQSISEMLDEISLSYAPEGVTVFEPGNVTPVKDLRYTEEDKKDAFQYYQENGFKHINSYIRGTNDFQEVNAIYRVGPDNIADYIRIMDDVFSKTLSKKFNSLWRGDRYRQDALFNGQEYLVSDLSKNSKQVIKKLKDEIVGKTFTEKAFFSTSEKVRIAQGFANNEYSGKPDDYIPAVFRISEKVKGIKISDMVYYNDFDYEAEILLRRGLTFEVTNVSIQKYLYGDDDHEAELPYFVIDLKIK